MAGRVNMRKHGRIRKCRPEDKKEGRKHPIEDQKWCLWDKDGKSLLYAGPTRKAVEKQERAVQYYKHNASLVLNGQVFRRALIQAAFPGVPPNWKLRVALTEKEMESKLRPWLSKLVKYAHGLEDAQEQLLPRLPRKANMIKQVQEAYPSLVKSWNANKMASVADAYGDIGMELVEISNGLQKVFRQRSTYANYLKQIAPALDKLGEDDPTKMLFLEAVASLHADEAVL